jgi:sulfane dehydrogenase subunit SoxC
VTAESCDLTTISQPSRVAAADEGIGMDELGLATRNHGLPLEALRYDITPLGLHYLLIHYDIPEVDPISWRLEIGGYVERPLRLSLDDLRSRTSITVAVTLECAGNGRARMAPRPVSQPWLNEAVGTMRWTGTPLRPLLAEAGVQPEAVDVVFTGIDHGVDRGIEQDYARSLPLTETLRDDVVLAYAANDVPLLPQHGFPLRLIVPGWYGMAHVKWLRSIDVIPREFDGFQQSAYRIRQDADDPGEAITRIEPRALVIPPGSPDFMSRARFLRPGEVDLEGRAWSGWGPVTEVEVTLDGGESWQTADLHPTGETWAWCRWSLRWTAQSGRYALSARATDATGRRQPDRAAWNRGGFTSPMMQHVEVLVTDR